MPKLSETKTSAETRFRRSFPELNRPEKGMPLLPTRVSDITLEKLGDLQMRYAAWREYAEDVHLRALSEFMRAKEAYDYQYNLKYLTANREMVTDKKAEAAGDPELKPLNDKFVETEIYLKMAAGKLESFSNCLAVISRELTRRGITP